MAISYIKLRAYLDANAGTYGALNDAAAAAQINSDDTRTRESISGSELFGYTDEAEYLALTDALKSQWLSLCAIDSVTSAAVPIIKSIFDTPTTTWASIVKQETKTFAQWEGFNNISKEDIRIARAQ